MRRIGMLGGLGLAAMLADTLAVSHISKNALRKMQARRAAAPPESGEETRQQRRARERAEDRQQYRHQRGAKINRQVNAARRVTP